MDDSDDDFAKLNRSFDELLIESDEEEPFVNDEPAVQSLIVLVESDSSENDEDDESGHDEEETWTEDAIIHDQFSFIEEYGSHADV